jgi:hypothetical protein
VRKRWQPADQIGIPPWEIPIPLGKFAWTG